MMPQEHEKHEEHEPKKEPDHHHDEQKNDVQPRKESVRRMRL